ncbi:hypothetical protein AGATL06_25060 [Agathobaculum sp. TL06]
MSEKNQAVTWETAAEWIGKELPPNRSVDEMNKTWIRWWLEVIEFDCPLHYDEEVARQYGHKGIIAPVAMTISAALPPYWDYGDAHTTMQDPPKLAPFEGARIPSPGKRNFATDYEFEFYEDLEPGDTVYSVAKLTEIKPKKLRVGDGAFLTMEKTYRSTEQKLLAIGRNTIFKFDVAEEAEA